MKAIKENDLVAVNDIKDGQIYIVESFVDKFTVNLTYQYRDGKFANGGVFPVSMLRKPTKSQLENYDREIGR